MTDRELMQMALEKLDFFAHMKSVSEDTIRLIADLRERLAQPAQQQEPVGRWIGDCIEWTENPYKYRKGQLLYTSPQPSKPWVGLTDEEIIEFFQTHVDTGSLISFASGAEYAEAKLREKNT